MGLDSSELFLERATRAAHDTRVSRSSSCTATSGRSRTRGRFDVVLNLLTVWGYYDNDENQQALQSMADVLRPGGRFVLEIAHRDSLVAWVRGTRLVRDQ